MAISIEIGRIDYSDDDDDDEGTFPNSVAKIECHGLCDVLES
jgi:hypothetical protein